MLVCCYILSAVRLMLFCVCRVLSVIVGVCCFFCCCFFVCGCVCGLMDIFVVCYVLSVVDCSLC